LIVNSDNIVLSARSVPPFISAKSSTSIVFGEYNHVATSYDGSILRLYMNGVEVDSSTLGAPTIPSVATLIGGHYHSGTPSQFFDGHIDEVRVWNIARTEAQIQANMYKTLQGNEANLVSYWQFDENNWGQSNIFCGYGYQRLLASLLAAVFCA